MKVVVSAEKPELAAGIAALVRKNFNEATVSAAFFKEPSAYEAEALGKAGVGKIWLLPQALWDGGEPAAAAALAELVQKTGADLLVLWASKTANEIGARAAQRLHASYAPECISLEKTDRGVVAKRLVLGGGYISTLLLKQTPAVVTLKNTAELGEVVEKKPLAEKFDVSVSAPAVEFLEFIKPETAHVELEKADFIVAVGRGFKKKEDLAMAEELARLIGAEVGCSRPISGDLRWLSDDRHIGLSGKRVRPKLYVALGISGQVQHLVGMRDSRTVVAVNIDPNAPIAAESDYFFVADIYKILPLTIQLLKEKMGS
ncbi:MAG: electron transfer flavoprotein subunit alpha/FixB family protein [Candidatus Caldarchaeum sp.]